LIVDEKGFISLLEVPVDVAQIDEALASLEVLFTLELLHELVCSLTVREALFEVICLLEVAGNLGVDADLCKFLLFFLEDLCVAVTSFFVVSCLCVERSDCSVYVFCVLSAIASCSEDLLVELNRHLNLTITSEYLGQEKDSLLNSCVRCSMEEVLLEFESLPCDIDALFYSLDLDQLLSEDFHELTSLKFCWH